MNLKQYLTEEVQDKMFARYMKALDRGEKISYSINRLGDELGKLQKQMKKQGIDELHNKQGHSVFDTDQDPHDRAWSMVQG